MMSFYSKRNQVYPVLRQGGVAIEKHFTSLYDWAQESSIYQALGEDVPHPKVIGSQPGLLITEYCPAPSLLTILEQQEEAGFSEKPWDSLALWLRQCHIRCGRLPDEGNLRNFLWDARRHTIIGLDFESYRPMALHEFTPRLIAALLEYTPADTAVKQQAASLLANKLQTENSAISAARKELIVHRKRRQRVPLSGIVLAGGASRRMGSSKADLMLLGKSLLLRQTEKLRSLGIQDILLSGSNCRHLPGTRIIPDELSGRGPLGGLHACLKAAENSRCLVLSVDVPLVPGPILSQLCSFHMGGVTVLRSAAGPEPLIGVYDKSLYMAIHSLIENRGAPVRALGEIAPWNHFDYYGPDIFLQNCNTPQDFSSIENLAKDYAAHGVFL